jgi:hypothetical protein
MLSNSGKRNKMMTDSVFHAFDLSGCTSKLVQTFKQCNASPRALKAALSACSKAQDWESAIQLLNYHCTIIDTMESVGRYRGAASG